MIRAMKLDRNISVATWLIPILLLIPTSVNAGQRPESLSELKKLPADTTEIRLGWMTDSAQLTECLQSLRSFKSLRSLDLASTRVTNGHLSFLKDHPNLESLTFRGRGRYGMNKIDDEGIVILRACPKLKHLHVDGLALTNESLKTLGTLRHLETLGLDVDAITDEGLARLSKLKQLKKLNLKGCQLDGSGLSHLSGCSALEELNLGHSFFPTEANMRHLGQLTQLRKLHLPSSIRIITDSGMAQLKNLAMLESLHLENCEKVTDIGFAHLSFCPRLKKLRLNKVNQMTRKTVLVIAGLSKLNELEITEAHRVSAAELEPLGQLSNLENLILWTFGNDRVGDFGFFKKLKFLKQFGTNGSINAAKLSSISEASALQKLYFSSSNLPYEAQTVLIKLTNLEEVHLTGKPFTDETVELLASMPSLRSVGLTGESLSAHSMTHFVKMQQLERLYLGYHPGLKPDEIRKLAGEMPHCKLFIGPGTRVKP